MPETTSGAILRGGSAALRRSARGPGISLSDIEEIAGIRVFQGVPKRELSELARMASITRFPADAVVLREGDPADDALLVVSGRLRASVRAGHRVRKLGSVRPGEVIGEGALFTGRTRRNATVTALEPSVCMLITRDLLTRGSTNAGVVAIEKHLLRVMSRRIRRTHKNIRDMWHGAQRDQDKGRPGPTLRDRIRGLFKEPA